MRAAFYTLGCKTNQYESQAMSELLEKAGFVIVPYSQDADVYIINSCTVTAESDRKSRQAVRRFKRNHPGALVVLTGCMPQAYPEKAGELEEADVVMGNRDLLSLKELIDKRLETGEKVISVTAHKKDDPIVPCSITRFDERTRAYIKIEDGCNRFCSYCAIPYSRGRVRSKSIEDVTEETRRLAENGYSEIVLTGINLSAYSPEKGVDLADAVAAAAKVEGIKRVRLGSVEPDHITDEMIEKLKGCKKLCPQFHLSLQSGCDETLKRMNRHYDTALYAEICGKLRESFADCALTTDVMVGFAGETDGEFRASLDFVKMIGFEKVHVFPYSEREGTRAAGFPDKVSKQVKEERAARMIEAASEIRGEYLRKQIGRTVEILAESKEKDGMVLGYTANYTPVRIKADAEPGSMRRVLITDADGESCYGKITE